MGKRKELRDDAILSADFFMCNIETILEKYCHTGKFSAEDCIEAIRTELYSGVWDTVQEAIETIKEK